LLSKWAKPRSRIQVTSELVLVNVVAHDKKGNLVRDLKRETSLSSRMAEAGISTFDFENVTIWPPPALRKQPSRVPQTGSAVAVGKKAPASLERVTGA